MKRYILIILCLLIGLSFCINANAYSSDDKDVLSVKEAIGKYENENDTKVETYRYFFLYPTGDTGLKNETTGEYVKSWRKTGYENVGPAVYGWDAKDAPVPSGWTGYRFDEKVKGNSVYYADIPKSVRYLIFNNGIDIGPEVRTDENSYSRISINIATDPKEYGETYPSDIKDFDKMIYVFYPNEDRPIVDETSVNASGKWYYYYGGSCFGDDPDGASDLDHYCLNAAHAGSHHDAYYFEDQLFQHYPLVDGIEVNDYNELYYFYDEENNIDYALIKADINFDAPDVVITDVVGSKALYNYHDAVPFSYLYAVYDVKSDMFIDIKDVDFDVIDGLLEVWTDLDVSTESRVIPGDADGSGFVDVADASRIQMSLAKLIPKYKIAIKNINADKADDVSIIDATRIQQHLAKLINLEA